MGADIQQASTADVRAAVQSDTRSAPPDTPKAPQVIDFVAFRAELFGKEKVTLLDARDEGTYHTERIPGAILVDIEAAEADPGPAEAALAAIPTSNVVVTYCSGGDCDLSLRLARFLVARGYGKVFVFEGGIGQWVEEGEATEQGGAP